MLRVRRPLRYKFIFLTTALLVLSVIVHIWLATQIIRDDKTSLVFELNRSLVTGIRNELSHRIETVFEKMSAWAILMHQRGREDLAQLAGGQSDIVALLQPQSDGTLQPLMVSQKFLESYGLKSPDLLRMLDADLTARLKSQDRKVVSLSLPGLPKFLALQRIVIEEDSSGRKIRQTPMIAILGVDSVLETMKSSPLTDIAVVDLDGHVLLSNQAEREPLVELVQNGLRSASETMVLQIKDAKGLVSLGAYSRSHHFLVVAATTQDVVFDVVQQLIKRSVLFAAIVICAAFLLILFFSKSITRPLEALMEAMKRVSDGDFSSRIQLTSNDEIAILATSFNHMISEVRTSRNALEEINRNLESKVAERTAQLEQQNQAVKEAQEALLRTTRLASVGEIAGRAAHEVLNPLTGILARLERIQKRLNTQFQKEFGLLKEIQGAWEADFKSGGMSQLTASLKSPSQIHQGQTMLEEDLANLKAVSVAMDQEHQTLIEDSKFLISESQRINRIVSQMRSLSHIKRDQKMESVHKLLKECANIMADLFDRDHIHLGIETLADNDEAYVNRDEFIQLVTNMLRNSLQAIRSREVSRGSVVLRTSTEGSLIFIDVIDNGIGMQSSEQKQLFANHFSTKDPSEGTGMGLSIARRFARGFHGDVALLKSEFGVGSTFRISIPVAQSEPMKGYGT